jgi:hypothetical protein
VAVALIEFGKHRAAVRELVNFDRDILDFVVDSLRDHVSSMRAAGVNNPNQTGEKLLRILEPVRKNDALRPRYETQCDVSAETLTAWRTRPDGSSVTGRLNDVCARKRI